MFHYLGLTPNSEIPAENSDPFTENSACDYQNDTSVSSVNTDPWTTRCDNDGLLCNYFPGQRNVATMVKVKNASKASQTKQKRRDIGTQTENNVKEYIPFPLPIYLPFPIYAYSVPVPSPVAVPLPIPIPIFIPTTRNSADGIMKEVKKIQATILNDPYQSDLLLMAEMLNSGSDEDETPGDSNRGDSANGGKREIVACPAEDSLIKHKTLGPAASHFNSEYSNIMIQTKLQAMTGDNNARPAYEAIPARTTVAEIIGSNQNSDCLKLYGVNAWEQWITFKNTELTKLKDVVASKLLKTNLLELGVEELNNSLTTFIQEVRKPNGQDYSPDVILYFCLGLHKYLSDNRRVDNILFDERFEKFAETLDETLRKFPAMFINECYIVTRVREEHFWECRQLGAYSPRVLLNTLMYFNTKYFNLKNVDEHEKLSLKYIVKRWSYNKQSRSSTDQKLVLRFHPRRVIKGGPQNTKQRDVIEIMENREDVLRCPVRLFDFYLSKCPESVKNSGDVFYLEPEKSCLPESPIWFSSVPLKHQDLARMFNRMVMMKEICVNTILEQ